jgi:hypothetical protein
MTPQEIFFLNTLDDLEEKLNRGDAYSIIRASGLLRQLLIDNEPLVHQINRRYRLRIEFEVIGIFKLPIRPVICWQNLDPSNFPNARKTRLRLDNFLSAECLVFRDYDFTVKDVITACAHMKGGIHSGKAENEKEEGILDFDEILKIGGLDATLAALRGIIKITQIALKPLVQAIAEQQNVT